jgi:hypothetical protein
MNGGLPTRPNFPHAISDSWSGAAEHGASLTFLICVKEFAPDQAKYRGVAF